MDIRQRWLKTNLGNSNNQNTRYDPLETSNTFEMGPSSYGERLRNTSENEENVPLYNNRPLMSPTHQHRYTDDPLGLQDDDDEYMEFSSAYEYSSNRERYANHTASGRALNIMNQASYYLYYTARQAGRQFNRIHVDPFYIKCMWVFCLIAIFFLSSIAHMLRSDSIYINVPGATLSKPELGTSVIWAIILYSLIFIYCSWSLWKHMKLAQRYAIHREFYYGSVSTHDALL